MKEEIKQKENKNTELNDEIKRLKYRLEDNMGDNEMNKDLLKELKIKEDLMIKRD
jgi:small-conductance mechanosensitive channel